MDKLGFNLVIPGPAVRCTVVWSLTILIINIKTCDINKNQEKDTIIFHGPSLTQLGINPLYRAITPSVLTV